MQDPGFDCNFQFTKYSTSQTNSNHQNIRFNQKSAYMKIEEFNSLNETEQEEIVWERGEFLRNHNEGNLMWDLYQLDSFYVSFFYELQKNQKATIKTFADLKNIPEEIVRLEKSLSGFA